MKDTPILFTPENAQKIFLGTKTQTRRIVKLTDSGRVRAVGSVKNWHLDDKDAVRACPYGTTGDRLWVREAFWRIEPNPSVGETYGLPQVDPLAYGGQDLLGYWKKRIVYRFPGDSLNIEGRKYPSIHMPRWACRTVLELTAVRVERLQEISEEDAGAEGCTGDHRADRDLDAKQEYARLWESINGPGSWELNPWVWVLSFKRLINQKEERA